MAIVILSLIAVGGLLSAFIQPPDSEWREIVSLSYANVTGTMIFERGHSFELPRELRIRWDATDTIIVTLRFESENTTYWAWKSQNALRVAQVHSVHEGEIVYPAIYIGGAVDGVSFDLRIEGR